MKSADGISTKGFALVATLLCFVLMAVLAVSMFSLSSVESRRRDENADMSAARANARLAMELALGRLQESMGPDTRVSASSGFVTETGQRHWTGAWDTQAEDGRPWVVRHPDTGGLYDRREGSVPMPLGWLVSGDSSPEGADDSWVEIVGKGTVADVGRDGVRVPPVFVGKDRLAWWVGDLGIRANLREGASTVFLEGAPDMGDVPLERLVSEASMDLAGGREGWRKSHFHTVTVSSEGLLTNTMKGGFKKNLGAYFAGDGVVAANGSSPGLRDTDRLAGPANEDVAALEGIRWEDNPLREFSPSFGILRHWAGFGKPADPAQAIDCVFPETRSHPQGIPGNLQPALISGATKATLLPVLVEASEAHAFSWFTKEGEIRPNRYLRKHIYPRVILWNPYPARITMPAMMVMIQTNGRHEFWMEGRYDGSDGGGEFKVRVPWLSFEGGRSRDFTQTGISPFSSPAYLDPFMGAHYYMLPATAFQPGESLVFTTAQAAEYANGIDDEANGGNLRGNLLAAGMDESGERCFTISGQHGAAGFDFEPTALIRETTAGFYAQFGINAFRNPLDDLRAVFKRIETTGRILPSNFDSLPEAFSVSGSLQYGEGREPVPPWTGETRMVIEDTTFSGLPDLPDERTRDGLRLAWRDEAIMANWNLRATRVMRGPCDVFERIGEAGMCWDFGLYRRFRLANGLPDPVGNGLVLFGLPGNTGRINIGMLRHTPVSHLPWHPARAVGESLADPRVGISSTVPSRHEEAELSPGHIGFSSDKERSENRNSWVQAAKDMLGAAGDDKQKSVFDLSYELNHTLWDNYYLDSFAPVAPDFHNDAETTPVPGAFNVNSLSEDAWAAVLARGMKGGGKRFPETGCPYAVSGRVLNHTEIRNLAKAIALEVRERGPFMGMSDFVNRRLASAGHGRCGALEAAIIKAGLNKELDLRHPAPKNPSGYPDEIPDPMMTDASLKPDSIRWGTSGHLTQGDILEDLGDILTARSDTFLIRGYGEAGDSRAFCEAIIQRNPADVEKPENAAVDFGREFRILSFRWIQPDEI